MSIVEKTFLFFFLLGVGYLLYQHNHAFYNEKVVFYECFNKDTQTRLLPVTKQEYSILKKNTYPKHLTCTQTKYTRYYVKLLKGPYKK